MVTTECGPSAVFEVRKAKIYRGKSESITSLSGSQQLVLTSLQATTSSESTMAILAGTMPLIELSGTEVKYLAKMNGESILVMHTIGEKNNTVLPDLDETNRAFAVLLFTTQLMVRMCETS